jgi:hypothetical protein
LDPFTLPEGAIGPLWPAVSSGNVAGHKGDSRFRPPQATLLQEQDDEWQVAERRYFSAGSMAHVDELGGETPRELLEAIA